MRGRFVFEEKFSDCRLDEQKNALFAQNMGRKRTAYRLSFAAIACLSVPVTAAAFENPLREFATCAGRLSAQMEHEWLMQDSAADVTQAHRKNMIDLVQATMEPGQGHVVLRWRIDAKMAHAALLSRGTFQTDAWAADRARALVLQCTSILIS